MKKFAIKIIGFFIIAVIASTSLFFSPPTIPDPARELSAYFIRQTDLLIKELSHLQQQRKENKPVKILQQTFSQSRNTYKRIESLIEYYFPSSARLINGPNQLMAEADNSDVPIKPHGFQVVEDQLFSSQTCSTDEITILLNEIKLVREKLPELQIDHRRIFDALRLQMFRVIALGITGFDSPVANRSISEAAASITGIKDMLFIYSHDQKAKPSIKKLLLLLDKTKNYLEANNHFDSFNRAFFIVEMANPITAQILSVQQVLKIPLLAGNRPLKNNAPNLFATDVFNLDFFDGNNNEELELTPEKIALGEKLFYDTLLTGSSKRSCATCHQPAKAFTDGLEKSLAINGHTTVARNAPSLWNCALQSAQFWDNRVASLEEQIEKVITNREEMNGNLENAVNAIFKDSNYYLLFAKAYGKERSFLSYRHTINAIASYTRSLIALNAKADQYLRGNKASMSNAEVNGFNLFMGKAKCATCHFAPLYNGQVPPYYDRQEPEVIGVPATKTGNRIDTDEGRYNQFKVEIVKYQFKVPSLRNVALTAPYMHNGVFATLQEVVDFYNDGGGIGRGINLPNQTLPAGKLLLTSKEKNEIVAFLGALTDTIAVKK